MATPLAVRSVTEEEIAATQRELEETDQERRDSEVLLAATQAREGTFQQRLRAIEAQRYQAVERLQTVRRELETVELEVFDINAAIASLNSSLASETQLLERKVRAVYKSGRTSALETVLSSDSFADALENVASLERLLAQDLADIGQLRSKRREVQLRTADLKARLDRSETLRAEAATIEAELAKRAEEQRDLIFNVQQERAAVEADIKAFEGRVGGDPPASRHLA